MNVKCKIIFFRIEAITQRGPDTKDPSWIAEEMKQISYEKSEKKNLLSWSTDEVYCWAVNVLKIDNNEAQILKEEGVDGFVLSHLNDQEMKGLNVKFGTKIKFWEGMMSCFIRFHVLTVYVKKMNLLHS